MICNVKLHLFYKVYSFVWNGSIEYKAFLLEAADMRVYHRLILPSAGREVLHRK